MAAVAPRSPPPPTLCGGAPTGILLRPWTATAEGGVACSAHRRCGSGLATPARSPGTLFEPPRLGAAAWVAADGGVALFDAEGAHVGRGGGGSTHDN